MRPYAELDQAARRLQDLALIGFRRGWPRQRIIAAAQAAAMHDPLFDSPGHAAWAMEAYIGTTDADFEEQRRRILERHADVR